MTQHAAAGQRTVNPVAMDPPEVRAYVKFCDVVITAGTLLTDFNTGAFTAQLDPARTVAIRHHNVSIAGKVYANVEIGDVLTALAVGISRVGNFSTPKVESLGALWEVDPIQ